MRKLQFDDNKHILAKLGAIGVFHNLSDDEKWELLKICKVAEYQPDEKIISQGKPGASFYAILSGTVNVTSFDACTGKEAFLSVIGAGEFFGEAGIFQDSKRTANVRAAMITEIICIKRSDFLKFIGKYNSAGVKMLMHFIDGLLRKLNDSNKELAFQRREVMDQTALDQLLQSMKNG